MDRLNKAVRPKYRYSVEELKATGAQNNTPFDLSKFSFGAVRAGIVTELAGCIKPAPRESAVVIRARNPSQQISDLSDQPTVHPWRQPKNAPTESCLQKEEGFAHFLKQHSSPNHHRVTAGGRIVPMEKKMDPPRFFGSSARRDVKAEKGIDLPLNHPITPTANILTHQENMLTPSKNPGYYGYDPISSRAATFSMIAPTGCVSQDGASQQAALEANLFQQNQILAYTQGFGYPQGLMSTAWDHTIPVTAPVFDQHVPIGLPMAPPVAHFNQYGMTDVASGQNLQTMLTNANNNFEQLDEELKAIDRYRATRGRDDHLIQHRVEVVVLRSQAKEEIRRIEAAMGFNEKRTHTNEMPSQPLQHVSLSKGPGQRNKTSRALKIKVPDMSNETTPTPKRMGNSKLNVTARPYVPRSDIASSRSLPVVRSSQEATNEPEDPHLPAVRYTRTDSGSSPELIAWDKWGERVGAPPPALFHEQLLLAEALLSQENSPMLSDKSHRSSSQISPLFDVSDGSEHGGNATNRHPYAVEEYQEKHIDTMRNPNGTSSAIILPNKAVQHYHGIDIKQPNEENTTPSDRPYWQSNTAYPIYSNRGNKKSSRAPSHTAETSTLSFEEPVISIDQAKPYRGDLLDSPSRQVLSELSVGMGHDSNRQSLHTHTDDHNCNRDQGHGSSRILQHPYTQGARLASSQRDDGNGNLVRGSSRASIDKESLANKTYSSTSVQNIHATSSLPRSLDGAVEAHLHKMNSPSKSGNKTKSPKSPRSPRGIFRSAGDVWYGPFRRAFHDKAKNEEDGAGFDRTH